MPHHAQKHHYVPEFYLAGFTPTGSKNDQLQVLDKATGKMWPAKPSAVGFERDLYRLEDSEVEPDALEQEFSTLEGHAARVPSMKPS